MDKPPAAESVDHGRSHPRSSGSARLPTYLILVTISTINLIYFTHCSPSRSPSLRPPPPGPAARLSASSARPPAVHLRRRPAQWDGGMSPLPAYGLPRLQSYDPLTAYRSRSLLRLRALRGTLVRRLAAWTILRPGSRGSAWGSGLVRLLRCRFRTCRRGFGRFPVASGFYGSAGTGPPTPKFYGFCG